MLRVTIMLMPAQPVSGIMIMLHSFASEYYAQKNADVMYNWQKNVLFWLIFANFNIITGVY